MYRILWQKGEIELRRFHRSVLVGIFLLLGAICTFSRDAQKSSYKPKNGFVPDSRTATRVAEAILSPIYGEERVAVERPFSAELEGNTWTVRGHLQPGSVGGVAEIQISKETCQIISINHGK